MMSTSGCEIFLSGPGMISASASDGTVFRHEGSDRWHLDSGNLYAGTEIRWEGSIIGSIEESGRITWEGAEWGKVAPFEGKQDEVMRVFAALYYFSNYFRRK